MTADEFRAMVLEMPDAVARSHMGHPDFRIQNRIFASLHSDDQVAALKVAPEEQQELMRVDPAAFSPATGAWGRQGWTNVRLNVADPAAVRGALVLAREHAAARRRTGKAHRPHAPKRTAGPARR